MIFRIYIIWVESFISLKKKAKREREKKEKKSFSHEFDSNYR